MSVCVLSGVLLTLAGRSYVASSTRSAATKAGEMVRGKSATDQESKPSQAPATPPPQSHKFDGFIGLKLSRYGFDQTEISRPKGHYRLYILNHSWIPELTFRLDRIAGSRLRETPVSATKGAWRDEIDLTPGEYQLSVVGHPDWACKINITPK